VRIGISRNKNPEVLWFRF